MDGAPCKAFRAARRNRGRPSEVRSAYPRSFVAMVLSSSSAFTRSCAMVSRSRTVTVPSSRLLKSTVTHQGVPISSWRRYSFPMAPVSS